MLHDIELNFLQEKIINTQRHTITLTMNYTQRFGPKTKCLSRHYLVREQKGSWGWGDSLSWITCVPTSPQPRFHPFRVSVPHPLFGFSGRCPKSSNRVRHESSCSLAARLPSIMSRTLHSVLQGSLST